MGTHRAASYLAVTTAFVVGSLSAHCAGPTRAPVAVAAEPCPPPPCASTASAPRSASLSGRASARIAAAKKIRALDRAGWARGSVGMGDYLADAKLEFVAVETPAMTGDSTSSGSRSSTNRSAADATAAGDAVKLATLAATNNPSASDFALGRAWTMSS
jgi:hypothetical protein